MIRKQACHYIFSKTLIWSIKDCTKEWMCLKSARYSYLIRCQWSHNCVFQLNQPWVSVVSQTKSNKRHKSWIATTLVHRRIVVSWLPLSVRFWEEFYSQPLSHSVQGIKQVHLNIAWEHTAPRDSIISVSLSHVQVWFTLFCIKSRSAAK